MYLGKSNQRKQNQAANIKDDKCRFQIRIYFVERVVGVWVVVKCEVTLRWYEYMPDNKQYSS